MTQNEIKNIPKNDRECLKAAMDIAHSADKETVAAAAEQVGTLVGLCFRDKVINAERSILLVAVINQVLFNKVGVDRTYDDYEKICSAGVTGYRFALETQSPVYPVLNNKFSDSDHFSLVNLGLAQGLDLEEAKDLAARINSIFQTSIVNPSADVE